MADPRECQVCYKFLSSKEEKEDHIEKDHFAVWLNSEQKWNVHIMSKHRTHQKHQCEICGESFGDKVNLNNHLTLQHGQILGQNEIELENHLKLVHLGIWTCGECGKNSGSKLESVIHTMKVHTTMKNYTNKDHIEAHLPKKVMPNNNAMANEIIIKHTCEYCGMHFHILADLTKHKAVGHLNIKIYECDNCRKTFDTEKSLRNHVKSVHTHKEKFKCEKCNKHFRRQSSLMKHVEKNHVEKVRNAVLKDLKIHQCEECPKTYSTKGTLKTHLKNVHSKVQEYICQKHCGKFFETKAALMQHRAEVARPDHRGYRCQECGKVYTKDKESTYSWHVKYYHQTQRDRNKILMAFRMKTK